MNSHLLLLPCFAVLALMGSVFAQDFRDPDVPGEAPWWQGHQGQPLLRQASFRAEGETTLPIEVFYPGKQSVETIDQGDLWVVSKNGYNALPALTEAKAVNFWEGFLEEEWPDDLLGPDGEFVDPSIFGFEAQVGVLATYAMTRDDATAWQAEDNDDYVILLEPREVLSQGNRYYEAARLGSLRVAVGEPEPTPPTASATIAATYPVGDAVTFTVTYEDERGLDLETIGYGDIQIVPEQDDAQDQSWIAEWLWGNEVRLVNLDASDDARKAVATYEVFHNNFGWADGVDQPGFAILPGTYRAQLLDKTVCDVDQLCVNAQTLGEFTVEGDLPEPSDPEVEVSVSKQRRGYFIDLSVAIDRGTYVKNWGTPQLDGDTYTIDLQLGQIPLLEEAADGESLFDWFGFGNYHRYSIGAPEPGKYKVVVLYQDELIASADFKAEEIDPNEVTVPEGHLDVLEIDGGYAAELHLELDGQTWVTNWGTPKLEDGSTFRIDLELEAFGADGIDPDVFGNGGEWFGEPYHRYELGTPSPGPYTIAVYYKDQLVAHTEFEAQDLGEVLKARLQAEPIFEESAEPYQFTINWVAGGDPNIEHLKTALVRVNRVDGEAFQGEATLVDVAVAESFPPQVMIRYEVAGPNGTWDETDNGLYEVSYLLIPEGVDPTVVRVASVTVGHVEVLIGDNIIVDPLPFDPEVLGGIDFEQWFGQMMPESDDARFQVINPLDDSDGDGQTNWEEYAFGTDPLDLASNAMPAASLMKVDDAHHLAFHFQHSLAAQVTPTILVSKNLTDWVEATDLVDLEVIKEENGTRQVIACLKESLEESEFRYIRMVLPEAP